MEDKSFTYSYLRAILLGFIIFSIKLLNDSVVEIKSTIKTPCFTDEYNVIIPQLIRKIRSKGFNEYTFKKQEISTSCYGSNHKSSYLVVSLNNDDDLMEKICLLLSIVNVFNEKFYDKLIKWRKLVLI